jgi:DNA-binding CsgD family transcriptional regulator
VVKVNSPTPRLSPREIECLAWAAQGKTYAETAMLLGISYGTVKTNLDMARYKLGAVNVTHAVALAILYGNLSMTEQAIYARQRATERDHDQIYIIGEMGAIR